MRAGRNSSLVFLIACAALAQTPNPGAQGGGGGGSGSGAPNVAATCAGTVTSCAVTIASLALTSSNYKTAFVKCVDASLGTDLGAVYPLATFTGCPPYTTVTPTFTSTTNGAYCTVNSSGVAGHQIYITSGGKGDIFDLNANTLTPITATG